MTTKQISLRIDHDLRQWLAKAVPPGATQQQYLTAVLRKAQAGVIEPTLFAHLADRREPPPGLRFRFIDLFAGIGGFRIGLTRVGGHCVFTSERDKFCQQTYRAWFGEDHPIHGDINEIDIEKDIPAHDVLAAGFPCQPFSIAGVSKKLSLGMAHGFECERQGNLFFKICDIIEVKRPPVLLLENVKNLKSHDKGRTWLVIQSRLKELDYRVFDQVIDARHWVPQHRERIFMVGLDRRVFGDAPPFCFPDLPNATPPRLGQILEPKPDPKYVLTQHLWDYLQAYAAKHRARGNGFGFGLVGPSDTTRTLSARYYKDGSEILIRRKSGRPRRLTHREAARLMGYGDEIGREFGHPNGFPQVVSDTQGYKQFGNSVVPAVVECVGREIVRIMNWVLNERGDGCLLHGRFRPLRVKPEGVSA